MSVNPPPNPNVATFNNLYWLTFGADGLTEAEADLLYLKFPVAQGTENLQAITINGITTAYDDINVADGTLGTSTINQTTGLLTITAPATGSVKILPSITFADNTIQTTAYVGGGLSPDPAGTYTTPSSVVVNSSGQVTSAVSGTTYTLPSPAPTLGAYTAPSSVSVNAAGQVTAITAGTAYNLPSPAPTLGAYTAPSSVSVNAEGQVTAITAGTAYNLPSPAPTAGSYTNSNITINSAGQVTAASNGSTPAVSTSAKMASYYTQNLQNTLPIPSPAPTITFANVNTKNYWDGVIFRVVISCQNNYPNTSGTDTNTVDVFYAVFSADMTIFPKAFISSGGLPVNVFFNNGIGTTSANTKYAPVNSGMSPFVANGRPYYSSNIFDFNGFAASFRPSLVNDGSTASIIMNFPAINWGGATYLNYTMNFELLNTGIYPSTDITTTNFAVNF